MRLLFCLAIAFVSTPAFAVVMCQDRFSEQYISISYEAVNNVYTASISFNGDDSYSHRRNTKIIHKRRIIDNILTFTSTSGDLIQIFLTKISRDNGRLSKIKLVTRDRAVTMENAVCRSSEDILQLIRSK